MATYQFFFLDINDNCHMLVKDLDGNTSVIVFANFKNYYYELISNSNVKHPATGYDIVQSRLLTSGYPGEIVNFMKIPYAGDNVYTKKQREHDNQYELDCNTATRFIINNNLRPFELYTISDVVPTPNNSYYGKVSLYKSVGSISQELNQSGSDCSHHPTMLPRHMLNTLYLDIECTVPLNRSGESVMCHPNSDPIIMISLLDSTGKHATVFTVNINEPIGQNPSVVTFGTEPIIEMRTYASEFDMLLGFFECYQTYDPDFLVGHNIMRFDLPYIYKRCKTLGIDCVNLSKFNKPMRMTNWKNFNFQYNEYANMELDWITVVDTLDYLKDKYKLKSYKLADVCAEFLKDGITKLEDVHYSRINWLFMNDLRKLADYCARDTYLCYKLDQVLGIVDNILALSNVSCLTSRVLVKHAQCSRVMMLVRKAAFELNFIVPDKHHASITPLTDFTLKGGYVISGEPDFYRDVSVYDFASLYPSVMMTYNICYTTFVTSKPPADQHILSMTTFTDEDTPEINYSFVTSDVVLGILPGIVKYLVDQRNTIRGEMKFLDPASAQYKVLDKKQQSMKLLANACYGFTASKNHLPSVAVSRSITGMGRKLIKEQVKLLSETGVPIYNAVTGETVNTTFKVVYGDTDSIMIIKPPAYSGQDLESLINSHLVPPLRMQYENHFARFLWLAKKMYFGYNADNDKIVTKGVVSVKRTCHPVTKDIIDTFIDKVLRKDDIDSAMFLLKMNFTRFISGELPLDGFITTRELKSTHTGRYNKSGEESYIPPQLVVYRKCLANQYKLDNMPQYNVGDRIPFVICEQDQNKKLSISNRAEHPFVAKALNLRVDLDYYFKSLNTLFTVRILKALRNEIPAQFKGLDLYQMCKEEQGKSLKNNSLKRKGITQTKIANYFKVASTPATQFFT